MSDKLTFEGDAFLYRGNQVAFVQGGVATLCCSVEDTINAELDYEDALEVWGLRDRLLRHIKEAGYEVEEDLNSSYYCTKEEYLSTGNE